MKKLLFTLLALGFLFSVTAQSTVGLVAHWDMNGEVSDVTGNGHNGTAHSLVTDTGISGLPNTAYYFNGVNSFITVPYAPSLNISYYTICAIVKVSGFSNSPCQTNTILQRGSFNSPDNYSLFFYDNPFDGNDCSLRDTTKDVFLEEYGLFTAPNENFQYTPTIIENNWYKLVATWNGTQWQLFVNGILKNTVVATGGYFTAGTDSISIGMNIFDASAGYTALFKGSIDDIRLYNRVLADSEIISYGDTCGKITSQPVTDTVEDGGSAIYTVASSIMAATYQWQQDAGTGFVNLSNAGPYSGVTTNTLTVAAVSGTLNNDHYRCIVSNSVACVDTSATAALLIETTGIKNVNAGNNIEIYPNPATSRVFINVSYGGMSGNVLLMNNIGQTLLEKKIVTSVTEINLASLPAGIYIAKIQYGEQCIYKKLIKN